MTACSHPKDQRRLEHGYDVACGVCGEYVGRVALFPCAVLERLEAMALLQDLPTTGSTAAARAGRAKLVQAVRS